MKLRFGDKFKEKLKIYGETIILKYYTIGEDKTLKKLESLWNRDIGCLDMTFDLTGEKKFDGEITILCTDHNDNVICPAFYISGDLNEFCWGKGKNRLDLNYITIYLPTPLNSNIETYQTKSQVKFLEEDAIVLGYSAFLSGETSKLLTRKSVEKFIFQDSSIKNDRSVYFNQNGERVAEVISKKYYKKLVISVPGLNGVEDNYGNITYYVGKGSTHKISSKAILDLYKDDNGLLSLVKKNVTENTTNLNLIGEGSNEFSIDSVKNTITFNDGNTVEEITLVGKIVFNSEQGEQVTITSNKLKFITYLDTLVEYSTDLSENGTPLFLFDNKQGSTGWNTSNTLPAKISVYIRSKDKPNNVSIKSDDALFSRYFNTSVKDPEYDKDSGKWKCTVSITTSQNNNSTDWFPLGDNGVSKLIKSYVYVGDNIRPESEFYCVQKGSNKIKLYIGSTLYTEGQKRKYTGPGVINISGACLVGSAEGYTKWEAQITRGHNIAISSMSGDISDSPNDSKFSFYLSSGDNEGIESSVRFRRLNDNFTYSKSNWRDLIYCNDEDGTLDVTFISEKPKPEEKDLYVFAGTDYFYRDQSDKYHNLLTFPRSGGEKVITIISKTDDLEFMEGNKEFSNQFRYQKLSGPTISDGKYITKIKIIADSIAELSGEFSQYSWWPKTSEGNPTSLVVRLGKDLVEKVYVAYLPILENTIEFKGNTGNVINSIVFDDAKGRKEKIVTVSSTNKDADIYYPYWYCTWHDPEVEFLSSLSGGFGPVSLYTDARSNSPEVVEFDPFTIRRVRQKYTNARRMIEDWENQLTYVSEKRLSISMKGNDPSKSISIFADTDEGLVEVSEEKPIELSYIGLYKIYVKSSGRFRIRLTDTTNESEGLYFYNKDSDTVEDGLSMIDFGSFSEVIGTEICLYYKGGEGNSFFSKDKFFQTRVTVENLETETKRSIRFHRTYFIDNNRSVLNLFAKLHNDDSNKSSAKIDDKHYVSLVNSEANSFKINYKSYIETSTDIKIQNKRDITIEEIKRNVKTNYSNYEIVRDSEVEGISKKIKRRGYQGSEALVKFRQGELTNTIPLKSTLYIDLKSTTLPVSPSDLPGEFKNQSINYKIFTLPSIRPIQGDDSVGLESYSGSTGFIELTVDKFANTTVYYMSNEETEYSTIIYPNRDYTGSPTNISVFYQDYTIKETIKTEGNQYKIKIEATSNTDYIKNNSPSELQKPSSKFLNVTITSKLNRSGLFDESEGIPDNIITQGNIDAVAEPITKELAFWRYGLEQSTNSFVNDRVEVSEFGERRSFIVRKKALALPLSYPQNLHVPYILSMEFSRDVEVLPVFASRLHTWYDRPISLVTVGGSELSEGTKENIKRVSTTIPVNFSILVGDEEAQPGEDVLTTKNVTLSGWKKGLKIGNKLYLGKNNEIIIEQPFAFNAGIYTIYAGSVNLTNLGSITSDINGTNSIRVEGTTLESSSSGSNTPTSTDFGRKLNIRIPENTMLNSIISESFVISDEYGNSVKYSYKIQPRNSFTLSAYSDQEQRNALNGAEEDSINTTENNLVFDGSGKLVSSSHVYVETEGSDLEDSFILELDKPSGSYRYFEENQKLIQSGQYNAISCSFTAKVISKSQTSKGKYLYKLTLTGRILGINGKTDILKQAYIIDTRLKIRNASQSSYVTIPNTKFGYGRVTITPCETFKSVKYWSDDLSEDIEDVIKYYPVYNSYYPVFIPGVHPNYIPASIPSSEVMLALNGSSDMEDTINVKLRQDVVGKDFCHTGFRITPVRREWVCKEYKQAITGRGGADIDIHVEGQGVHVYFGNKTGGGFSLDVDDMGHGLNNNKREIITGTQSSMADGDYDIKINNYNDGSFTGLISEITTPQGTWEFNFKDNSVGRSKITLMTITVSGGKIIKTSPVPELNPMQTSTSGSGFKAQINWVAVDGAHQFVSSYEWEAVDIYNSGFQAKIANHSPSNYKLLAILKNKSDKRIFGDNKEIPGPNGIPESRNYTSVFNIQDTADSDLINNLPRAESLGGLSEITEYGTVTTFYGSPAGFLLHIEAKDFVKNVCESYISVLAIPSALESYGPIVFKLKLLSINIL